jgi:DNA-binding MarR family transcriptional regulator
MAKPATTIDLELVGRFRIALARLGRLLRQQDQTDIPPAGMIMLSTIGRKGPITLGQLATSEQLAPPTVTKAVARLENDGLVERLLDPSDRRVCRVVLTPAGRKLLISNQSRRTAWLAQQFGALSADEQQRLADAIDVLERMAEP